MALKQEIGENTNNHSNHLKKKVNSLKKKVDEYYEETQIIRSSYQKQNQILNQLQEKVRFIKITHREKKIIFDILKKSDFYYSFFIP